MSTAVATGRGPRRRFVGAGARRWGRRRSLLAGFFLVGAIVLMAAAAPLLTRYDPTHQDFNSVLLGPSRDHFLGTDDLGRDIWSRILYGARIDLRTAFLAVLFPFVIGTALGSIAGFYGGIVDSVVSWASNVVFAFPFYVLIIALVFALGAGARSIYIAITIVGWVSYARIVRGEMLVAKHQEYVQAARIGGLGNGRIIVRHLLPNVIPQAVVFSMSDIVLDLLAIVTLGFLGLGIQPPTPDWGRMVAEGQQFLTTNWGLATFPGIAIVLTGIGLALVADGLADLLRTE
ncbi:MAG: ABC transporter permease [Actinomycetota bacterium]|nr:ABC transporter permease [Actinomycetota bacterium]